MFVGFDLNADVIWAAAVADGEAPTLRLLARYTVETSAERAESTDVSGALVRLLEGFLQECDEVADDRLHVSCSSGSAITQAASGLWPHIAQQVAEERDIRFEEVLWPRHEAGAAAQRCRMGEDQTGAPVELPMAARAAVGVATLQAERAHAAHEARQDSQGVMRLSTELASLRHATAAEEARLRRERDVSRSEAEQAEAALAERDLRVASLEEQVQTAHELADGLRTDLAEARSTLATQNEHDQAQHSDLAKEAEESRRSLQALQLEVAALQAAERVARSAADQQASVLEALQTANDQAMVQRSEERETHEALVEELQASLHQRAGQLSTAKDELERTTSALESASREIRELTTATEELRVTQVQMEEDLADARATAEMLTASRDDIAAERDRAQAHFEERTQQQRAEHDEAVAQERAAREKAMHQFQTAEMALDNARTDHAAELEQVRSEAADVRERIESENTAAMKRHTDSSDALKGEHAEALASLEAEHEQETRQLRAALEEEQVKSAAAQEAAVNTALADAAARRDAENAAAAKEHQVDLNRLRTDLAAERGTISQQAEASLMELTAQHQEQLGHLERMRARALNEQTVLSDNLQSEMQGRLDALSAELSQRESDHKDAVAQMKKQHVASLENARQSAADDAEAVRERHEQRLVTLRRVQEDRLAQLETAHAEALDEALGAHRTIQTELHQRIADHQRSLADERQHSERERDALATKHREVLSQLIEQNRRAHDQLRTDLEAQQTAGAAGLAEVMEDRRSDETRFQNELDAIRGEASTAQDELAAQLDAAEKKRIGLETQLRSLQDERSRLVASHVEGLRSLERRQEGAEARLVEAANHREALEAELRQAREAQSIAEADRSLAFARAEEAVANAEEARAKLLLAAETQSAPIPPTAPIEPDPDVRSLEAEVRRLDALREALQNQRDASREQAVELQRELDVLKGQ